MEQMTSYLNKEHIARSHHGVEYHPLIPFLPANAKVLFLGSFPPPRKRWCMDFYYPNFINDHWRIEGAVFFGDRNHFVDEDAKRFKLADIVAFCQEKGIAGHRYLRLDSPTASTTSYRDYGRKSHGDALYLNEYPQRTQSEHLCPYPQHAQ